MSVGWGDAASIVFAWMCTPLALVGAVILSTYLRKSHSVDKLPSSVSLSLAGATVAFLSAWGRLVIERIVHVVAPLGPTAGCVSVAVSALGFAVAFVAALGSLLKSVSEVKQRSVEVLPAVVASVVNSIILFVAFTAGVASVKEFFFLTSLY